MAGEKIKSFSELYNGIKISRILLKISTEKKGSDIDLFKNFKFLKGDSEKRIFALNNWGKIFDYIWMIMGTQKVESVNLAEIDPEKLFCVDVVEFNKLVLTLLALFKHFNEDYLISVLYTMKDEDEVTLSRMIESTKRLDNANAQGKFHPKN